MKNSILIVLCFCGFISCKSKSKTPVQDSLVSNSATKNQSAELIKKFKPIIDGVWVRSDYIDTLRKSRSPYASKVQLGGVASMSIQLPNNDIDSTHVGYSLNNHEGSDFVLYFKKGQINNSLKTGMPDYDKKSNFYELGYSIESQDTTLVLYHVDLGNHIVDKTKYVRVANNATDENDAGWGIQYITNKVLITGRYLAVDSAGKGFLVEFNNEGIVSGFSAFKKFYINTDFEAGPDNDADDIIFDLYTPKSRPYMYSFKSDTLLLFEEKHNADSTKMTPGKLKYKLVRQK